jgi:hypothetical protein
MVYVYVSLLYRKILYYLLVYKMPLFVCNTEYLVQCQCCQDNSCYPDVDVEIDMSSLISTLTYLLLTWPFHLYRL